MGIAVKRKGGAVAAEGKLKKKMKGLKVTNLKTCFIVSSQSTYSSSSKAQYTLQVVKEKVSKSKKALPPKKEKVEGKKKKKVAPKLPSPPQSDDERFIFFLTGFSLSPSELPSMFAIVARK